LSVGVRLALAAVLFVAAAPALAIEPDEVLRDPALEARARGISAELRCLVCQNQSIDDSDAPLARDLRLLVRDRLKSGDTDAEVRSFVVQRYGEFVLLRPPVGWHTALLWAGPPVVLIAAAFGLLRSRRQRRVSAEPPLSPEEEERIRTLQET
jgi:cytochrome c-type biogenesis protein CcmH